MAIEHLKNKVIERALIVEMYFEVDEALKKYEVILVERNGNVIVDSIKCKDSNSIRINEHKAVEKLIKKKASGIMFNQLLTGSRLG